MLDHSLLINDNDQNIIDDIVVELRMGQMQPTNSSLVRLVHTLGRNKKIIAIGTLTLASACVVGTYLLAYHPPFDAQAFINAYDSSLTGEVFTEFSEEGDLLYEDYKIPTSGLFESDWCLPNGLKLYWDMASRFCGNSLKPSNESVTGYRYVSPVESPPQSFSGPWEVVCNKTTDDTAAFLHESCGFNTKFWQEIMRPFNIIGAKFNRSGFYCNLHPSNQKFVCAQVGRATNPYSLCVEFISQISLEALEQAYNNNFHSFSSLYGGLMGAATFTFLGFYFLSWCLG